MKQRVTPEDLVRQKLSETAVPHYTEGWQAMQSLLDHQPLVTSSYKMRWVKRMAVAALALLLTSIGSWWWMHHLPDQGLKSTIVLTGRQSQTLPSSITPSAEDQPGTIPAIIKPLPPAKMAPVGSSLPARPSVDLGQSSENLTPRVTPHNRIPLQVLQANPSLAWLKSVKTLPDALPLTGTISSVEMKQKPALFALPSDAYAETLAAKETAEAPARKWHIAVRLNANGGSSFGDAATNYNPVLKGSSVDVYPSVYFQKGISSKLSLQAGFAMASPVNVKQNGFTRSVSNQERAMAYNMSESRDRIEYNRLYYADFPLTLQYHLTPHLSLGSGFQVSLLQKTIGKKQRMDYNQLNALAYLDPVQPEPQNLSNDEEAGNSIRPLDLRWVAGLKYQFAQHWEASLQYQYGLTDISKNRAFLNDHTDRNMVFNLGLGFLIH